MVMSERRLRVVLGVIRDAVAQSNLQAGLAPWLVYTSNGTSTSKVTSWIRGSSPAAEPATWGSETTVPHPSVQIRKTWRSDGYWMVTIFLLILVRTSGLSHCRNNNVHSRVTITRQTALACGDGLGHFASSYHGCYASSWHQQQYLELGQFEPSFFFDLGFSTCVVTSSA